MTQESIGKYLNREVNILRLDLGFSLPRNLKLSDSVVMLCIDCPVVDDKELDALLNKLVITSPLAILASGQHARVIFDSLLEMLSKKEGLPHIMTALCEALDISECVQELLWATWPSEDRFDNWKAYAVIIVGNPSFSVSITECLRQSIFTQN